MKMSGLDWVVWILLFVGGLNWGTIGFFNYDFVSKWFGGGDMAATFPRIIFALVGLAALWSLISMFMKGGSSSNSSMGGNM